MCKIGGAGRLYDIATEHFMTVKEVAALLRVEKTTIYRWIENGKLNAKKISKKKYSFQSNLSFLYWKAVKQEVINVGMTKAESRKLPHGSNKKYLPYAIIVYRYHAYNCRVFNGFINLKEVHIQ